MKKIMKLAAALALVAGFANTSNAQFGASVGLEVAMPLGDFSNLASFGAGVSGAGEYAMSDNAGITGTIGYIYLAPADGIASAYMMPMQLGFKYYFDSNEGGFYGHGQLGVHTLSATTEDFEIFGTTIPGVTASSTELSYAVGAGYLVGESLDFGLRYNIISGDGGSSNYLGVRVGYNF